MNTWHLKNAQVNKLQNSGYFSLDLCGYDIYSFFHFFHLFFTDFRVVTNCITCATTVVVSGTKVININNNN